MTSHGMHTHPPIPPTKTPVAVGNQLIRLIHRSQKGVKFLGNQPTIYDKSISNLTVPLLASPVLQAFCQKYNHRSTDEVYTSLVGMDPIQAIFQKKRGLAFPGGLTRMRILFQHHYQKSQGNEVSNTTLVMNQLNTKRVSISNMQMTMVSALLLFVFIESK